MAGEQGHARAQYDLGECYSNGLGVPKNAVKAVEWYSKAAGQGIADAQIKLGDLLSAGNGVPKDAAAAAKWYTQAAEQGRAAAQVKLGDCYIEGEGVPKNPANAVEWYTKAAEQAFAVAQNSLGVCCNAGEGLPRNASKAVEWYTKAAFQGLAQAQYNLADCYMKGRGVPKNPSEALKWYTKAAEQGYAPAQNDYGMCCFKGIGMSQNIVAAAAWFAAAAEQGLPQAQSNLGKCCYDGTGVPKDSAAATAWLAKAAEQGVGRAPQPVHWSSIVIVVLEMAAAVFIGTGVGTSLGDMAHNKHGAFMGIMMGLIISGSYGWRLLSLARGCQRSLMWSADCEFGLFHHKTRWFAILGIFIGLVLGFFMSSLSWALFTKGMGLGGPLCAWIFGAFVGMLVGWRACGYQGYAIGGIAGLILACILVNTSLGANYIFLWGIVLIALLPSLWLGWLIGGCMGGRYKRKHRRY